MPTFPPNGSVVSIKLFREQGSTNRHHIINSQVRINYKGRFIFSSVSSFVMITKLPVNVNGIIPMVHKKVISTLLGWGVDITGEVKFYFL